MAMVTPGEMSVNRLRSAMLTRFFSLPRLSRFEPWPDSLFRSYLNYPTMLRM